MTRLQGCRVWILLAALFPGALLGAAEPPMPPLFAVCHDTHDAQKRTLAEQAEMLAGLGFAGAGHLWFGGVEERLKTLDAHKLKLFQIYERVDLAAAPAYDRQRFEEVLPLLKGRDVQIALLFSGGRARDASLDERAVEVVREIADAAASHGVTLLAYPHRNNWLETVDDGLRVVKKVDRKNVGVMFNLCHWAMADPEKDLRSLLQRAMPHLRCVTINGSDSPDALKAAGAKWIAPLDEGNYDIQQVVRLLQDLGYRGPIGLQCFGIAGDARLHLERSMRVWRSWYTSASPPGDAARELDFDPTATPALQWMPAPNDPVASPEQMKPYIETIRPAGVTFEMVPIPGGTFLMGSPAEEAGRKEDEGPRHAVTLEPFWMGRYEVTWNEYNLWAGVVGELPADDTGDAGRGENDPARRQMEAIADAIVRPSKPFTDVTFGMGKSGCPAFGMTQLAARCYCKWLCAKTGHYYRLPTEAEWEYACRAGTTTAYSFGDDPELLGDYGWFFFNGDDRYHKVGQKRPNPWGLYDMHGNVCEWVLDAYGADYYSQCVGPGTRNPLLVPQKEYPRVVRGGCWDDDPDRLRSAARGASEPDWKSADPRNPQSIWQFTTSVAPGFRVVRPLRTPTSAEARLYEPDYRAIEQYHSVSKATNNPSVPDPGH